MFNPILITGAAGGQQGSTGRVIATLLLDQQGVAVRAHSSTSSMRGQTNFAKKAQRSSRATSSIPPRSRRL